MPQNCTTNPITGCVDCPFIEHIPPTPAHIVSEPRVAWDAGANSIDTRGDDQRLAWTPGVTPKAIVCGFKQSRVLQTRPELVLFGWYVQSLAGQTRCSVIERGIEKTSHLPMTADSRLEIRRRGSTVSYRLDGREVYVSSVPSYGVNLVNACLYVSGDSIQ